MISGVYINKKTTTHSLPYKNVLTAVLNTNRVDTSGANETDSSKDYG